MGSIVATRDWATAGRPRAVPTAAGAAGPAPGRAAAGAL